MSYTVSVPATAKAGLDAAVDALVPIPALVTDEAKGYFEAAQAAVKAIGDKFDGGYPITVVISGSACQEAGDSPYDSVSIVVAEVAP